MKLADSGSDSDVDVAIETVHNEFAVQSAGVQAFLDVQKQAQQWAYEVQLTAEL